MAALYRTYASTQDAENGIERLLSAGVRPIRIQLITDRAVTDARDAPIGTFAGTTTADAQTVGSFANIAHSARVAMGTFAGDPNRQRRGAFGDTVTTYQSGVKRTRIASHDKLKKLLVDAGLDKATATAEVEALHAGRVLVLVQSESALHRTAAVIDELDQRHEVLRAAA